MATERDVHESSASPVEEPDVCMANQDDNPVTSGSDVNSPHSDTDSLADEIDVLYSSGVLKWTLQPQLEEPFYGSDCGREQQFVEGLGIWRVQSTNKIDPRQRQGRSGCSLDLFKHRLSRQLSAKWVKLKRWKRRKKQMASHKIDVGENC